MVSTRKGTILVSREGRRYQVDDDRQRNHLQAESRKLRPCKLDANARPRGRQPNVRHEDCVAADADSAEFPGITRRSRVRDIKAIADCDDCSERRRWLHGVTFDEGQNGRLLNEITCAVSLYGWRISGAIEWDWTEALKIEPTFSASSNRICDP